MAAGRRRAVVRRDRAARILRHMDSALAQELPGELIAASDREHLVVDADFLADVEVLGGEVLGALRAHGDTMTAHQRALCQATVGHTRLTHLAGFVLQVVINDDPAGRIVFSVSMNYRWLVRLLAGATLL